jgi:hypothetical protein
MTVIDSTSIASSSLVHNVNNLPDILLNSASPIYFECPSSLDIFLQSHGIPVHDNLEVSQMVLIHHLLNGICI